jgi:glyoxylase-like metal-dependent hydrolase (beta-lactamase superfamily II)
MYTGNVHVAGPADVRELSALIISKIAVGPMDNNSYLLRCRRTGQQVLIDAAAEPERLLDLIGDDGLDAVVTTHAHRDHWANGLAQVVAMTGALTYAHPADAPTIDVPTTNPVSDGDLIPVGACVLKVNHLIGHTPGSIAMLYDDPEGAPHLFTGDCLFPGGVGKTASPEAFHSLLSGVVSKLFDPLPDETWVYPGHGADTTIGRERPALAGWAERGW